MTLYPCTILNSFILITFCTLFGIFCLDKHITSKGNCISPCPKDHMNFISLSPLITLVMASRTVLKTCSENQCLCIVRDFRRKVFSTKYDNDCKDSCVLWINFVILQLEGDKPDCCWCFGYRLAEGSWRPHFPVCGGCCFRH